jgi:hypothetical protein
VRKNIAKVLAAELKSRSKWDSAAYGLHSDWRYYLTTYPTLTEKPFLETLIGGTLF